MCLKFELIIFSSFIFPPQSGQHLIIPEQSKVEINEHLKIARGKLQLIPNKIFEELVIDLFEEVDRREMETSKKKISL
jgi:hypothetical protein